MKLNRVLFIPVSSSSGIGEYMRSLIIAKALKFRWPNISIHFILNEQVSYFNDCPYIVHGCKDSPTKDTATVNRIIEQVGPSLVIFDASGRAEQFKKAKVIGAKVAFISQHNKKRSRGLKLNRLPSTDIHWVVQPDYCIKPISLWQRVKLAFFNKKAPKNLGPVFELSSEQYQAKLLECYNLVKDNYLIFNAGSGGHLVSGKLVADIYYQAAQDFQQKTGIKSIVVFGDNYPNKLPSNDDVTCIKSTDNKDFISLIIAAKACVISAGDTLLQCIALQKLCVAAPVSPDQPARLKLCEKHQFTLSAEPNIDSLVQQAQLIINIKQRDKLIYNLSQQNQVNALELIVDDITSLFSLNNRNIEKGDD